MTPVRTVHDSARIFTLAYLPSNNQKLVTGDASGFVRQWDFEQPEGRELVKTIVQHDKQVRIVVIDKAEQLLLVGGEDHSARVFELRTGQSLGQRLSHRGQVRNGAFLANSKRLMTIDFADGVHFWNLDRTRPEKTLAHKSPVVDVAIDETGTRILAACASDLGSPGAGYVWKIDGDSTPVKLEHNADVMAVTFRPGFPDQAITCGNDGRAVVWDRQYPSKPCFLGATTMEPQRLRADWFNGKVEIIAIGNAEGLVGLWTSDGAKFCAHELRHPSAVFDLDRIWLFDPRVKRNLNDLFTNSSVSFAGQSALMQKKPGFFRKAGLLLCLLLQSLDLLSRDVQKFSEDQNLYAND